MAISYVTASTGTTDAGGAWSHTAAAPSAAGNILIVQVVQDGAGANAVIDSVTNAENLAGTDNVLTSIGEFSIGGSSLFSQHLWIGRSLNTSAMVITGSNAGTDDIYIRVYEFSGVHTGTTLASVIENVTAGTATNGEGSSTTVADTGVTTLGTNRLALNFIGFADDLTGFNGSFTGETGGDWATVASYGTSTGTDASLNLNTATMASAGTINGGTMTITSMQWGVVGFALIPADDPTLTQAAYGFYEDGTEAGATVLNETVATYYFDGSDAAASDTDAVWTDETNADDGSTSTYAYTTVSGSATSNEIIIQGTNAPGNSEPIKSVRARVYGGSNLDAGAWGASYATLTTPSGGWTWAKIQALEANIWYLNDAGADSIQTNVTLDGGGTPLGQAQCDINDASAEYRVYRVEIEVTYFTNITRDVSAGDSNLQLRVRLQETNASNGPSTDDYQLQYELNDSGIYNNVGSGVSIDYLDEISPLGNLFLYSGSNEKLGQSFTGNGAVLDNVKFHMARLGSPTGNAVVKIYAHSGSFGTSSVATGAALATSATFDVSTLSTSKALITFAFSGADRITLTNATNYVASVEYTGGDASNSPYLSYKLNTHAGNYSYYSGGVWTAGASGLDLSFYVDSTASPAVANYNSASLTDGNATTNRLGSGTGSFVAGEISEDGLVDNFTHTASNYTEHLYSLTIDSDAVADADTLDFRVLRNGATTGMTYTVTPRITIEEGGATPAPSVSDSTSITESVTVFKDTHAVSVSDSIAITENRTALIPELLVNKSDSVAITDTPTVQQGALPAITISVSDSIAVTEAVSLRIPELLVNRSDTVTLTENSAVLIPELVVNKSESATITEAIAALIPEFSVNKSESITIIESVNELVENYISISESTPTPISASGTETTGSNGDATSYTTGSYTPTANKLQLLWVYSIAATAPNTPTVSGAGLTWVEVDNQIDSGSVRKITLFRAMGASPSAGALTIDFAGQTQTGCAWSWVQYTGADTSGTNGSGSIVQSAKDASAVNATNLTVTLGAFSSVSNATAGGFGIPLNTAGQPNEGSGFTDTGQRNQSTPNLSIGSEFLASNDTTVDMDSGAASIPWVGIAVELKVASSPAEAVTITENATVSIAVDAEYNISKSESVTITESTKLETENRISIPEAVSVTDTPTVTVDNRVLSKTENISISEGPGTASATATYYFNASVSGPTDIDTVWTDDANAFDGSTSTLASTTTNGDTFDNYLAGTGTDAPGSGEAITQVRARVYGRGRSASGYLYAHIDYSGSSLSTPYVFGNSVGWGGYDTLSTPTGGWTWTKVQNLTATIYTSLGATNTGDAYRVEVEVTSGSAAKLEVESFINKTENITATENLVVVLPNLYLSVTDNVTATENLTVALAQYNVSVTDNITATEQLSLLITELHINVQEAVSVGENIVASQGVESFYNVNKTETVTISESTTAVLSDVLQSVSDNVSVTESLKLEVESSIVKTENATVSESLVLFITELFSTNQDTVTITESIKLEGESTINKSDTATVSESIKLETDNRVNVSDSTTVSESIKLETENTVNKTDSITVTENVDPETVYLVSKSETVTLGESTKQEVESFINKSDSATVTENRTVVIPELLISKTETVTATESLTVFIPEYKVIETENVTLTEQLSLLIPELYITVQDSVSTSENVLVDAGNQAFYNAQASESVAVSESVQIETSAVILTLTDNITLSESATVEVQATATPLISKSETVTVTEQTTLDVEVKASVSDTATVGESTKQEINSFVNKSDTTTLTESTTAEIETNISVSDTTTLTESLTVEPPLVQINVSDTTTVTENVSVSRVQHLTLSVSDSVNLTEYVVADVNNNQVTYPRVIITIYGKVLIRAGNSKVYIPL